MDRTIVVPAPAKVNLFLHVVGRRADGYHLLESAMAYVRFGDTLILTRRTDERIEMLNPIPGVAPEEDLCVRAARALRAHARKPCGVSISIEKRIPMGAGLGGGSSDAASVLLALNVLWELHFPRAVLMQIGLPLGADVPFFVFGKAAIARGIGERLTACSVPHAKISLLKPSVHAATPSIFRETSLRRDFPTIERDAAPLSAGENALQPVAEKLHPEIAKVRVGLAPHARMTGSGACVFALHPPTVASPGGSDWYVETRLMNTHPLYAFAKD